MNAEQTELTAVVGGAAGLVVALLLVVACALLWRSSRRLAARVADLEAGLRAGSASTAPAEAVGPAAAEPAAYVMATAIDEEPQPTAVTVPGRIDGALFADIVARESVIKAAGLAHGLRRALSPETRNRIRFEMRREVKRSRKQRRADLKAALREVQTRDRAAVSDQQGEGDAA